RRPPVSATLRLEEALDRPVRMRRRSGRAVARLDNVRQVEVMLGLAGLVARGRTLRLPGRGTARPRLGRTRPLALRRSIALLALLLARTVTCAHARGGEHGVALVRRQFLRLASHEARRHRKGAEARPDQPAHREAQRFEQPPNFAVAPFLDDDAIPV